MKSMKHQTPSYLTTSKTETRLEVHRRELQGLGGLGPMLQIDDLSGDEIALINSDFLARCHSGNAEDIQQIYTAYVNTLHSWGVMCPHPQPHRLYGGWLRADMPQSFNDVKWFNCGLCSTSVINR